MELPTTLRARHVRGAARSGALILVVCAGALAAFTVVGPNSTTALSRTATACTSAMLLLLAAALCALPAHRLDRSGVFLGGGLGGVLLICVLNVLTHDPSAAAQSFLSFPVLWAAAHLRRGAVVLICSAAVISDAFTLGVLERVDDAVIDVLFVGTVLVVTSVMLDRGARAQERLVAALQAQATVDSLTGLVNRRVLDEALAHALERSPGPEGTALVLIDVDSFKHINDQHGHPVGDDALVHIAGLVRRHVRAGDAVLCRLGGDELAVLLPGCPADIATQRAGELLDAVRSTPLVLPDGELLGLSVSIGVAHAQPHTTGLRALYSAADAALYSAKRAGRGRVEVAAGS